MKKKLIASLAAAAALGTSFLANAAIEKNQLTVWVNDDKGYNGIAKVGERYTKKTGVKVTVAHPAQPELQFQQAAAIGSGPDILLWGHDRYGEWASAGLIAPITPSAEEKAKFADFAWDAMTYSGKIYGYPLSVEALGLICNRKLVPEAPENWEDFAKLDDELQKQGAHAVFWEYTTPYFSYPLISANGGYAFKKSPEGYYNIKDVGVANEGSKAGVKFIVDMIKNGHLEKKADNNVMEANFTGGKLGCILNGSWSWSGYEKAGIDFSVNRLPKLSGKWSRPFVGVQGFVINSASPNRELARDFLENYLLTDEGLKDVNDDKALGAAALKSFQEKLAENPRVAATMANAEVGDLMPSVPEMSRFWYSFQSALKYSANGRQTVDDALETAAMRISQ
ncbi:MAG: maltose/maltodextrin ABC transporter substrate-binding protein MalE [Succinivibrionaceae bacterium]|nr:maltose/maltodextrin ABC transporter substrate-binding protein MalE [Succinivibrionaceae bacterium]